MDILKETFIWLTLLDAESIMKAYRDCRVFNFCCVSISLLDDELMSLGEEGAGAGPGAQAGLTPPCRLQSEKASCAGYSTESSGKL